MRVNCLAVATFVVYTLHCQSINFLYRQRTTGNERCKGVMQIASQLFRPYVRTLPILLKKVTDFIEPKLMSVF